jgi:glutathione S-transferase
VADSHPLVTPRVRGYMQTRLGISDEGRVDWARHWFALGLDVYEGHPARDKVTGAYCHGGMPTMADIRLVSHCVGYAALKGTLDKHPTVKRIYERCMADDRFASAHPLRQPGAPDMP